MSAERGPNRERAHHAPEPWSYEVFGHGVRAVANVDADGIGDDVCGFGDVSDPVAVANAERAIACVNACAGIPTEVLRGL